MTIRTPFDEEVVYPPRAWSQARKAIDGQSLSLQQARQFFCWAEQRSYYGLVPFATLYREWFAEGGATQAELKGVAANG